MKRSRGPGGGKRMGSEASTLFQRGNKTYRPLNRRRTMHTLEADEG